ncbi:MAG: hypothetical protein HKN22_01995 [Bacteroidia bacterium]|nr:hypothetical protein [Bacteroidia bacterium]
MRILGNIDHDRIKFTVFEDNNKIIVQCEDGLCQVTYKYRKGDPIEGLASIQDLLSPSFVQHIESQLSAMNKERIAAAMALDTSEIESFPEIV